MQNKYSKASFEIFRCSYRQLNPFIAFPLIPLKFDFSISVTLPQSSNIHCWKRRYVKEEDEKQIPELFLTCPILAQKISCSLFLRSWKISRLASADMRFMFDGYDC